MGETSHAVILRSRPVGEPAQENFALIEEPRPEPGPGQVLVRNLYISVDPYMRGRMRDVVSYVPPYAVGAVMDGGALGRVEVSNHPDFGVGDYVASNLGWREWFVSDGAGLRAVNAEVAPLSYHLGVLGGTGFTAYIGLLDLCDPQEGETVFVSGAAGAVGLITGQLAKIRGCRVVGSAGSDAKVDLLVREIGYDAAFNYKTADLEAALAEHCPGGIDIYFDNVGGDHLQAALNHMRDFGRIAACGAISLYNMEDLPPGPNNLAQIIRKRLRMQGFIVSDHFDRRAAFERDMLRWLGEGQVQERQTVVDGIENAPRAFLGLFRGDNVGKMLVRLDPDAPA